MSSEESLLHVQAGVVSRALTAALVRAVHRVTRGNCVVHDVPIDEPLWCGHRLELEGARADGQERDRARVLGA